MRSRRMPASSGFWGLEMMAAWSIDLSVTGRR
jgi:hypothetical protein